MAGPPKNTTSDSELEVVPVLRPELMLSSDFQSGYESRSGSELVTELLPALVIELLPALVTELLPALVAELLPELVCELVSE